MRGYKPLRIPALPEVRAAFDAATERTGGLLPLPSGVKALAKSLGHPVCPVEEGGVGLEGIKVAPFTGSNSSKVTRSGFVVWWKKHAARCVELHEVKVREEAKRRESGGGEFGEDGEEEEEEEEEGEEMVVVMEAAC